MCNRNCWEFNCAHFLVSYVCQFIFVYIRSFSKIQMIFVLWKYKQGEKTYRCGPCRKFYGPNEGRRRDGRVERARKDRERGVQQGEFVIVENIHMSGLSARFNSWVKTNPKLTPNCQLRERAKLHSNPDVWSLIYNFSLQSSNRLMTDPPHFFFHSIVFDPKQKTTQDLLEVSKKFKKKMVTSYLSHLSYFERLADEQTNN